MIRNYILTESETKNYGLQIILLWKHYLDEVTHYIIWHKNVNNTHKHIEDKWLIIQQNTEGNMCFQTANTLSKMRLITILSGLTKTQTRAYSFVHLGKLQLAIADIHFSDIRIKIWMVYYDVRHRCAKMTMASGSLKFLGFCVSKDNWSGFGCTFHMLGICVR